MFVCWSKSAGVVVVVALCVAALSQPAAGAETQGSKTKTFAGIEFVWIAPGTFKMGSPAAEADRLDNEGPQHEVTLSKGFWMGKYEVTQAQWQTVMGENPAEFKGDTRPVEMVSWKDCQDFVAKLNARGEGTLRLPTEAKWEYACRAGSTTAFAYGDDPAKLGDYAWYGVNSEGKTHPVGEKKPNAWGLYDMHGNVWEWCQDKYVDYTSDAKTDPAGAGRYPIFRSGCWRSKPGYCRSANRNAQVEDYRVRLVGLRLVRDE